MVSGTNPTPPIDGKEYELMYKLHVIGPYAHDIYGLLVDYGNAEGMYNVDNVPVENFTERLDQALGFAKMLVSLVKNGVDFNGFTFSEEKYVSPVIDAIKHNLYQCIKEMEDEVRMTEERAEDVCESISPEEDEYKEYHQQMPTPKYEKRLEDWLLDNYKIMDMLPSSTIIASLSEPLTEEALDPICTSIGNASEERMRVKDIAERDMEMYYFLSGVFALGVPAINEVFQDLYDSLVMFHRIPKEQIRMHQLSTNKYAGRNYIRGKYNLLKEKGRV